MCDLTLLPVIEDSLAEIVRTLYLMKTIVLKKKY